MNANHDCDADGGRAGSRHRGRAALVGLGIGAAPIANAADDCRLGLAITW